jgi:hypothetical protein
MIGIQFHGLIPTKATLNGPFLRFTGAGTTQPFSTSVCSGSVVTFTGIATAFFPTQDPPITPPENVGILTYRWYEVGVGPLSDSANISGTATTTLTISNVRTPQDGNRSFYLRADYVASTSGENFAGNAVNEPLDSSVATLGIFPDISITSQPSFQVKSQGEAGTFSVDASSTDPTQGTLNYQWTFNGSNLSDGTFVTNSSVTSQTTIPGFLQFNQTFTNPTSSVSIPSGAIDVEITVAGAGGGKGGVDAGIVGGNGGGGIIANFTLSPGQRELTLLCGSKGGDGNTGNFAAQGVAGSNHSGEGGRGGGAGPVGFSGGGGAGGGSTIISDSVLGNIIVAGGGGGGGGASLARQGGNGANAQLFSSFTPESNIQVRSGGAGGDKSTDAGGGGGGGGGGINLPNVSDGRAPGGNSGTDNVSSSTGGTGGGSNYNNNIATASGSAINYNSGDGYVNVRFKYPEGALIDVETENTTVVSGSNTKNLSVTSDLVGLGTIRCVVSNPVACNSPIFSNVVDFNVIPARPIIYFEEYNDDSTSVFRTGTQNLANGPLNLLTDPSNNRKNILISPSERNVIARITLAAAAGLSNAGNRGGAGGVTVFQYTLQKNIEYNIILGFTGVNRPGGVIGGGVGAYFYDRAKVAICCGGGGGAGTSGRGGDGGGAGVRGERGGGSAPGNGGSTIFPLPNIGSFAGGIQSRNFTERTGGVLSACIIGDSYYQNLYSSCQDIGESVQARNNVGTIIQGSALLRRGYKPGLSYRNNAGNGSGINGGGGQGAVGGDGAISGGSGGGGGSGYSSGDAIIINATLGGNPNPSAYATIELL